MGEYLELIRHHEIITPPWLYKEFLESPWPLVYIIVYGVGFLISMISPSRGLQDRIAGTYLVPR